MGLAIGLIFTFILISILGGVGFLTYKQIKATDTETIDTSTDDNIQTAQEFLPFQNIKDGMIDMGAHQYRAVIECSSTNYNLKTDKEKEIIELSFQRFLNSLTFPITFFIHTKLIDNSKVLESLRSDMEKTVEVCPQLSEYANVYLGEMANLSNYIGNNKQKKKYIIVPYHDAISLANLSDEEKYEYSRKELMNRVNLITDGLTSVGVKTNVLDTRGIVELVYSPYHKDSSGQTENIVNGEFLTLLVEGEGNREEAITDDARIDWILYEAQMRIKNELSSKNVPEFRQKDIEKTLLGLDNLRDITGGYYKSEDERNLNIEKDQIEFEL